MDFTAAIEFEFERVNRASFLEALEQEIIDMLNTQIRRTLVRPHHAPFPDRIGCAQWRDLAE